MVVFSYFTFYLIELNVWYINVYTIVKGFVIKNVYTVTNYLWQTLGFCNNFIDLFHSPVNSC